MKNIIISSVVQNKIGELVKLTSVDAGFRYADIANCTYTEMSKMLEMVESVILKRPADAIYIAYDKWSVDLKKIDVEFLKRVSKVSPAIDSLIHHFHEIAFADITLPRSEYFRSDTIESILIELESGADRLMITKNQLQLLKNIYMISCSDKTVVVRDVIYGVRKYLRSVEYLMDICMKNNIKVGVLDGDGVERVGSFDELESCARTFPMDRYVDIYPSGACIGDGPWIISNREIKTIHTHIHKLLRTGCHDDTKFVFMKTSLALKGVRYAQKHKHILNPYNVSYYNASDDARHHDTVVLLGAPRISANTAFITDPDPEMCVERFKRFALLRAIGRARVVYCVGLSTRYLKEVLSDIPGIWYYDEHRNDPSKK